MRPITPSSPRSPLLALVCALAAAGTAEAQLLHVVDDDGGPGVDFTSLFDAVSLASPGDTLLVRSGDYDSLFMPSIAIDVPLTITAEAGAVLSLPMNWSIADIAAGEAVVLRGLNTFALSIDDCGGVVALKRHSAGAVFVRNSGRVVIDDSELISAGIGPVTGLQISDGSNVNVFRSLLRGADAGLSPATPAVFLTDSNLYLYDTEVVAGANPGGAPVPNVQAAGTTSIASRDLVLTGGSGIASTGAVIALGPSRSLTTSLDTAREGEVFGVRVDSLSTEAVVVWASPSYSTDYFVDPGTALQTLGPPPGSLVFTLLPPPILAPPVPVSNVRRFRVPELGFAVQAANLVFQGFVFEPFFALPAIETNPACVLMLDASL